MMTLRKHQVKRQCNFKKEPTARNPRRGAVSLEFALVFPIYILAVISAFTIGIRIYQTERFAAMAKYLARKAIVRGAAAEKLGPWGPATITGSFGDGSVVGNLMASKYSNGNPMSIYYRLTWPDGGNDGMRKDRVEVTISSASLSGGTTVSTSTQSGSSSILTNTSTTVTMTIAH
jgi:uncharacterized protein (UPF0333 family)